MLNVVVSIQAETGEERIVGRAYLWDIKLRKVLIAAI